MAALSSLIEYKDLTSYVISLPKTVIEKIFDHPTTCLTIFRELPELAKIFVTRLLLLNQEVPQTTINSWINSKYQDESKKALNILTNLGIWQEVKTQGGMPAKMLKKTFRENLFKGIFLQTKEPPQVTESGEDGTSGAATANTLDMRVIEKLDHYAVERWESVLKYIVNPKDSRNQICNSTKEVLKFAGLMKSINENESQSEDEDSVVLTASAFQFLLWNRKLQIWYFILQLLEYCWQKKNMELAECLTLLFELSFSTFGKDYSCEEYSPGKVEFLQELRALGLVFMKTRKIKRFYPTRLVIQLVNGVNNTTTDIATKEDNGYIIVETNYRVYAYTNSHLQISLLALFSELMYRFPNMVVGILSRESVREAFKMGITAQQIVNFLRSNAHPQIATRKPVIPEVVIDQIFIWYAERNRLKFSEGVFYGQFNSDDDYLSLRNYAKDIDSLIWSNDTRRLMVVKKTAHDAIKKYYKQNKKA